MTLTTHGDRKYLMSDRPSASAEWDNLRIEHRWVEAGVQAGLTLECTELVLILSGHSKINRTGDGVSQDAMARPGTVWLCPAGTDESRVESSAPIECLHLYLPQTLVDQSALADYDIDPDKVRLAYAGGFGDPMLTQIGGAFRGMLDQEKEPTNRLFVDGMQAALAAHLLGNYTMDRWHRPMPSPSLDPKRLKRVLDFVEARLATEIALDDLAAEACLSPFHFSRLFRDATGQTPHRYVTERRVQAAKDKLAINGSSLVEIALDTGFGSQANFIRVFRKATGLTPGQYRDLHLR